MLFRKSFLLLFVFSLLFIGCSSDDDGGSTTDANGQAGDPHHYDLSIKGNDFEGNVDNIYGTDGENGAITAVSTYTEMEGKSKVVFSLQNNDMLITGELEYPIGEDNNVSLSDTNSIMTIIPGDINDAASYDSKSGSASVNVGEEVSLAPGSGVSQFAELHVEFNGTFTYRNSDGEKMTAQASGSFTINLPPGY